MSHIITPVYKFARGQWHRKEYLFYASTPDRAIDFACAWRRANRSRGLNGGYLGVSFERGDEPNVDTYRGWTLDFEYGYHTAVHSNYDASWEGPEDGWVDNGLRLSARTLDDLIAEIDEHEASTPTSWDPRTPVGANETSNH